MEMPSPPLEIQVHLEDGRVVKFAQEDADAAQKILSNIKPGKLFSESVLVLSDNQSTIAFQSAKVVRIDMMTQMQLEWPFPSHVKDCRVISWKEFQQSFQSDHRAQETPSWMLTDNRPTTVFAEMELVNGAIIFLETDILADRRLPLDQSHFLHRIFASGGLHARRKDGGMMIVNPACIARLAFYPGTLTVPPGVWEATCVSA